MTYYCTYDIMMSVNEIPDVLLPATPNAIDLYHHHSHHPSQFNPLTTAAAAAAAAAAATAASSSPSQPSNNGSSPTLQQSPAAIPWLTATRSGAMSNPYVGLLPAHYR